MNNKIIYLLCVFLLLISIKKYEIEGHAISKEARIVKSDEIWDGNISIVDDTVIEENVTLTINPGTKIVFYVASEEEPPRLVVKGILKAQGEMNKKILFTSSQEALISPIQENKGLFDKIIDYFARKNSETNKIWGGIHFKNTKENKSIISYCIIEYAKDGIVCNNSSPRIEYSLIKKCQQSGILCNLKSNPEILNNSFEDNNRSGVYCHQESAPMVSNNTFERLPLGIYSFQAAPVKINKNNFVKNNKGIYCRFPSASPVIIENFFKDNDAGIFCEQNASPKIQNNKFEDNKKAIYLQRLSNPLIERNKFNKNEFAIYCFQNSSPVIFKNEFKYNKNAVYLHYASYPTIKHNLLDETNNYAIKVGKQSYVLYQKLRGVSQKGGKIKIGRGKFAPKQVGKKAESKNKNGKKDFININSKINAKENYWGEGITKIMENSVSENINISSIWDGNDEPAFEFEGEQYPQDKVDYDKWLKVWNE